MNFFPPLRFLTLFIVLVNLTATCLALPVARVRGVVPVAEIGREGRAFRPATDRAALNFGDIVQTRARGRVELLFNNGTQILMRENTSLQIVVPATPNKPLVVRVFGALGEIFVRAKGPTEIRTAAGTAAVRGTEFSVRLDSATQTTLLVREGEVGFSNPLGAVSVGQNQSSTATTTSAPTAPVAVDPSGLLAWTLDIGALPVGDLTDAQKAALEQMQNGAGRFTTPAFTTPAFTVPAQNATANDFALSSLALLFGGQSRAALSPARQAVERDPFSPLALLALSRARLARGEVDEATQAIAQAAALAPQNALLQTEYGALLTRLGQLPRAQKAFEAALKNEPQNATAIAGLASVQNRLGQTETARAGFEKALALAPQNAQIRAQYAAFLVESGDLNGANRIGQELLAARENARNQKTDNQQNGESGADLGALFIRLSEAALLDQKLNPALSHAQKAVELLPDSAPARYQLGRVLLEQNRTAQAQNQFRLAVALDPFFHRARFALGLTQQRLARGDSSNFFGQITAAQESSASSQLDLQNLGTPGQNEQLQAVSSDPLTLRTASRSFGDTEISGQLGEDQLRRGEFSHLREFNSRRSVAGVQLRHFERDGVLPNASNQEQEASFSLGGKSRGGDFGYFLSGRRQEAENLGSDIATFATIAGSSQLETPELLGSLLWQNGETAQTRLLLRGLRPKFNRRLLTGARFNTEVESEQVEVRHDRRMGAHRITLGAALGQRKVRGNGSLPAPGGAFITRTDDKRDALILTLRDDWQLSPRFNLVGELKGRKIEQDFRNTTTRPGAPTNVTTLSRDIFVGDPMLLLGYRPDARTSLRLRYARETAFVRDFDLLSPTDIFLFSPLQDPERRFFERERRVELEIERTLGAQTFVRAGLYDLKTGEAFSRSGDNVQNLRYRGARIGVDTLLTPQLSLFATADYYDAKGQIDDGLSPLLPRRQIPGLPKYLLQMGGQYLRDDGFFVQPSLAFLGRRVNSPEYDDNFNPFLTERGSFALANLRVGKRFGLKATFYAEVSNLFDKEFALYRNGLLQQPGRSVNLGATLRF